MKNRNNELVKATYSVAIVFAKSSADVFHHVTKLSEWWPEEFVGEKINLNTAFVFRTGDGHYSKNKVTEFVPNKKLAWQTTESHRKGDNFDWTGTKMIFELASNGDSTLLTFTYDGVVLENEKDRLVQVCDFCIKDSLYNFVESFKATIEVEKSTRAVFDCLKKVPKWWSQDFEGSCEQLNDEFIIHHRGAHYSIQKLVEVIPEKKIVWLVTDGTLHWLQRNKSEWTNTEMIFEISSKGNRTELQFTHKGLVPNKECYTRCAQGWNMVIKDKLFNFITTGKTI